MEEYINSLAVEMNTGERETDEEDQVRADKEERELDYQEAELHPSEGLDEKAKY